jgi:hypothetical protein
LANAIDGLHEEIHLLQANSLKKADYYLRPDQLDERMVAPKNIDFQMKS